MVSLKHVAFDSSVRLVCKSIKQHAVVCVNLSSVSVIYKYMLATFEHRVLKFLCKLAS